jgi:mannose-6-phosphate isomerase-like protein (cupin superfamily)
LNQPHDPDSTKHSPGGRASAEIIEKPWGRELIFAENEHYLGKLIEITGGSRLSLQYHPHKDETVYVTKGTVETELGRLNQPTRSITLRAGDCLRLRPATVHRFGAVGGDAQMIEVSTPHPDDTVRLADDFGRS